MENSNFKYNTTNLPDNINSAFCHELENGLLMIKSRIHVLEHLCPELQDKEQWNLLASDIAFMNEQLTNIALGYDAHTRLETFDLLDLIEDACESFEATSRTNQIQLIISSQNAHLHSITDFYGEYLSLKNCIIHLLSHSLQLALHCQKSHSDIISIIDTSPKIIPLFEKRTIYISIDGYEDAAVLTISTYSDCTGSDSHHHPDTLALLQTECEAIAGHGGRLGISKKGSLTSFTVKLPKRVQ